MVSANRSRWREETRLSRGTSSWGSQDSPSFEAARSNEALSSLLMMLNQEQVDFAALTNTERRMIREAIAAKHKTLHKEFADIVQQPNAGDDLETAYHRYIEGVKAVNVVCSASDYERYYQIAGYGIEGLMSRILDIDVGSLGQVLSRAGKNRRPLLYRIAEMYASQTEEANPLSELFCQTAIDSAIFLSLKNLVGVSDPNITQAFSSFFAGERRRAEPGVNIPEPPRGSPNIPEPPGMSANFIDRLGAAFAGGGGMAGILGSLFSGAGAGDDWEDQPQEPPHEE